MNTEKFNFDEIVDRRGTHAVKWDYCPSDDVIPMWVADMDFKAAPCIMEALRKRVEHGVFGYVNVPEEFHTSIINWFERRHNWTIDRDMIEYTTGVVPAISAVIKAITKPGQKVAILTPIYNCFFSSIKNNGCDLQPTQPSRTRVDTRGAQQGKRPVSQARCYRHQRRDSLRDGNARHELYTICIGDRRGTR